MPYRFAALVLFAIALFSDVALADGNASSSHADNDASAGVYAVLLMGLVVRAKTRRWRLLSALMIAVLLPLIIGSHR